MAKLEREYIRQLAEAETRIEDLEGALRDAIVLLNETLMYPASNATAARCQAVLHKSEEKT